MIRICTKNSPSENIFRFSIFLMLWLLLLHKPFCIIASDEFAAEYPDVLSDPFFDLADSGVASAQIIIGRKQESVSVTPQSMREALRWYQRAANQGNAQAEHLIRCMQDKFQAGADTGDSDAQCVLGILYEIGEEQNKDLKKAYSLYKLSAEQDNAYGQCRLAWCYYFGLGVSRNYDVAVIWFQKAAKQGLSHAFNELGRLYENGHGTRKDLKKAYEYYAKSARLKNAVGQANLGRMYLNGFAVEKDLQKAKTLFEISASQASDFGQAHLGLLYYFGTGVETDYEKAYELFSRAASKGNSIAQYHLGRMLSKGQGVPIDEERAFQCFLQSARQGNNDAENSIIRYCQQKPENIKNALKWLKDPACKGCQVSRKLLERIYYLSDFFAEDILPVYVPPADTEPDALEDPDETERILTSLFNVRVLRTLFLLLFATLIMVALWVYLRTPYGFKRLPVPDLLPLRIGKWLLFCLFFAVIPAVLAFAGYYRYMELRAAKVDRNVFAALNRILNRIESLKKDEVLFCRILARIYQYAEQSPFPERYLAKVLPRLKRIYGNYFKFIVWDGKGNYLPAVSDFKTNQFLLKNAWTVFGKIAQNQNAHRMGNLKGCKEPNKVEFNRLQYFLGSLLVRDHLVWPYRKSQPPSIFLVSPEMSWKYLWFHVGSKIGLMCFIDERLIKRREGLKRLVASYNLRSGNPIKLGLSSVGEKNRLYLKNIRVQEDILSKLRFKSRRQRDSTQKFNNVHAVFRTLDSELVIFGFLKTNPPSLLRKYGALIPFFLLLVPWIVWSFMGIVLKKEYFVTILIRFLGLFFAAAALPLLAMSFLGNEVLEQKRATMEKDVIEKGVKLLNSVDAGFMKTKEEIEIRFKNLLQNFPDCMNPHLADHKRICNLISEMKAINSEYGLVIVYDKNKQRYMEFSRNAAMKLQFPKLFGSYALKLLNSNLDNQSDEEELLFSLINKAWLSKTISLSWGKLIEWNLVERNLSILSRMVPAGERRPPSLYAFLGWSAGTIERQYIRSSIINANRNALEIKVLAWLQDAGKFYPKSIRNPQLKARISEAATRNEPFSFEFHNKSNSYIVFGSPGKALRNVSLVGIYPMAPIDRELQAQKKDFLFFGVLNLLIVWVIGRFLSSGFLGPINHLSDAARALERREFTFQLPQLGSDEFGKLGEVFNKAFSALHEVESAKIVHDSLFPDSLYNTGKFIIYGRSISMGRLGGDYFDYFPVTTGFHGVLIGDATGHGLPAALTLGIAKAAILSARKMQKTPVAFLNKLHEVFFRLKNAKNKRLMTMCYLLVDENRSEVIISNAGHVFPLFYNRLSGKTDFISLPGVPLGSVRSARFSEVKQPIQSGDKIVLFTDGFIESFSPEGIPFGLDRLQTIVEEFGELEPKRLLEKISERHIIFTGCNKSQDDLTMVIVSKI